MRGYWIADIGYPPVQVGYNLNVLAVAVFLAGEQSVVALAVADRGEEPVDQDRFTLGVGDLLLDLRMGYPPQNRCQIMVVAGDRSLRTAEHLAQHIIGQVVP